MMPIPHPSSSGDMYDTMACVRVSMASTDAAMMMSPVITSLFNSALRNTNRPEITARHKPANSIAKNNG